MAITWHVRHSAYIHAAATDSAFLLHLLHAHQCFTGPCDEEPSTAVPTIPTRSKGPYLHESMHSVTHVMLTEDHFSESSNAIVFEPIQGTSDHVLHDTPTTASRPFLTAKGQPDAPRANSPCRGSSLGPHFEPTEGSDASGHQPDAPRAHSPCRGSSLGPHFNTTEGSDAGGNQPDAPRAYSPRRGCSLGPPLEPATTNPMLECMRLDACIENTLANLRARKKRQRARKKMRKRQHAEAHE